MKKKNILIFCGIALLVIAGVIGVNTWRNGEQKSNVNESYEEAGHYINEEEDYFELESDIEKRLVKRNKDDIVWTVSSDAVINEEYLTLFNKKLKEDGYSFQLKFQYMDYNYYNQEVRKVLENGDTDIALGGQDEGEFQNVVAGICRDGLFANIESYLNSDIGKALWEEYEEPLWGSVTVDGNIYTIPNSIYDDGRFCVVFNNKYIDTDTCKKFVGDITTLDEYITDEIKKNPAGREFVWSWNSTDLASVLGYYQKYGMFFEAETGEIISPFACEEMYNFMKMLNELQMAGCVAEECSLYGEGADYSAVRERMEEKKFSILLTKDTELVRNMGDDVTVVALDFTPNFERIGGTNGICAKSEHVEEAVQLLSLLHTEDEYAHLLLYGKEGKDYEIVDGRIESENCADISTIDILGIYRSSYPDIEELIYTENIRQQKREIYRSKHCKTSVFSGFQIDETDFTEEELLGTQDAELHFDIWKGADFEEKFKTAHKELEKGEEKVYQKLKKQVQAWEKSKES